MRIWKWIKKYGFKTAILVILMVGLVVYWSNKTIEEATATKHFNQVEAVPKCKVGLVLGTIKTLKSGNINPYFKYRIDAAVKLYKSGKVEYLLVSGDNSREGYDEPSDFKNSLIARGVPADKIFLDYAGFRTLDSVVRSKEIFGQNKIVIISQKFHNERAIYLAEKHGVEAYGFNAQSVRISRSYWVAFREYLARVKVFVDLILGVDPHFGGKPIKIQ